MAKIIVKDNTLSKKYVKYRFIMSLSFGISIISILLFGLRILIFDIPSAPSLLPIFFIGMIIGYIMHGKSEALKSGVLGEKTVEKIISKLPDSYYGYKNLKISFKGQESELDMVVVGPTGVFIIETKNMRGYIYGNYDNTHWVQQKIGRGGTPYSKEFYSPVKQVGTHTYRLANSLRDMGIKVHISPTVFFSNCEASLQISGAGDIPVFAASNIGTNELVKYITKQATVLSASEVRNITAVLNNI